jgi:hypothetical protein
MAEQDERAEADDAPREPAPKRGKKKKKKAPPSTLDAEGRERPRFVLSFPRDPELDRLVRAFEGGDYATVRRDATALAEKSDDAAIRDAALELRRRIDPDPLIRYLLLISVLLLGFLVLYVYTHRL